MMSQRSRWQESRETIDGISVEHASHRHISQTNVGFLIANHCH